MPLYLKVFSADVDNAFLEPSLNLCLITESCSTTKLIISKKLPLLAESLDSLWPLEDISCLQHNISTFNNDITHIKNTQCI